MWWLLLWGCAGSPLDSGSAQRSEVDWQGGRVPAAEVWGEQRGLALRRAIVHLHSPWSHDACDGDPLPDGEPNAPCLDDLRYALCHTAIDAAFLTDHPTHFASVDWADAMHSRPGDEPLVEGGETVGALISCDNGNKVTWIPGTEDELSWLALDKHIAADPAERERLYNQSDAEAMTAGQAAGGLGFIAHTEGRDAADLAALQNEGLGVVEVFNLHAMFAPDIRRDHLGLDPTGWASAIAPFTDPDGTATPDLLFLGVLGRQDPSFSRWVELMARGPVTAVAGTDAHQNVIALELRDDERLDSYRRMLRWFTNVLLVEGDAVSDYEAALREGRNWLVFDAIGTPTELDLHLVDGEGVVHEVGSTVRGGGTLQVGCPVLHPTSPRGPQTPTITVGVYRDEVLVQEGCGTVAATEPGAWRVEVTMVPLHLARFVGEAHEAAEATYPWLVSNAIRVTE